jgi:hypothetical protein
MVSSVIRISAPYVRISLTKYYIPNTKTRQEKGGKNMAELSEAAREARRAYDRAYYRRNPEKQREKMRRYWERKSAQIQAQKCQDRQDEERSEES